MPWIFIFLSFLALSGAWTAYSEAKQKRTLVAWGLFIAALASVILSPIDRVQSDWAAERDRVDLQKKISLQDDLIEKQSKSLTIILNKNAALEKQVELLNLTKKQILKLGIRFKVRFVVDGVYLQPTYKGIPPGNPPYAIVKSLVGGNQDIWLQSQDMNYNLGSIGTSGDKHTFTFETNGEILNARYPVGEPLNVLKKYETILFYIPFLLRNVSTGNTEVGQQVMVESVEGELIVNGTKVKRTISGKSIRSRVGPGIYDGQNYWIVVPVRLSKDIYSALGLSKI